MTARLGWAALAVVALSIASAAIARWIWAVTLAGPVLYGEGAVAHAALLSRYGYEYTAGAALLDGPLRPIFTAANYPPLYFKVAGLGDPFVSGRIASIVAALLVATAVAWRARAAGPFTALAIAAGWIASFPVIAWGAALKPDLVALALTVGGVCALAADRPRPLIAGVLLALAIWTKPTAVLPAVALAVWCARRDRRTFWRYAVGVAASILALGVVFVGPAFPLLLYKCGSGFCVHVLTWNALPWRPDPLLALLALGSLALGVPLLGLRRMRAWSGPVAAYAFGALGVVLLGGREGATLNYLLDLSAAAALAVAGAATGIRASGIRPAAVQLAVAFQLVAAPLLLDPFGALPWGISTGRWGDPERIEAVRALPPGPALVEDSGLLLAVGREPVVDDLFLWSRLRALSVPGSFSEGDRLIDAVGAQRFTSIVSEADLGAIERAPAYERARWHPDLVRTVLERYILDRRASGLWVYLPR